jgi:pimeloyl-ACP methyl ester carboxylesterase
MADQIPSARLTIILNAAHLASLEQPEVFNHIVAAFASELGKEKQS